MVCGDGAGIHNKTRNVLNTGAYDMDCPGCWCCWMREEGAGVDDGLISSLVGLSSSSCWEPMELSSPVPPLMEPRLFEM